MWSVKWTFPEKRSKSSLFFLQKIKCHLYSLGNNSLEINIHSQKIVQRPRGVQFPPPCDRWNPLFPCHNQGHYYLITEMSDSPSGRLNSFFFPSTYTSQHRRREITGVSDWRFVLHDTGCQKKRKNSPTKSAEGCLQSLDTHINIHLCTVTVTFPCFSLFSLPLSDCPPLSFPRSLSSLGKIMMTKNRSHWQCSHGPAGDYSVLTKANNKYGLQEQQVSDKIVSL